MISRASGSATATTTSATPGSSSATRVTDQAAPSARELDTDEHSRGTRRAPAGGWRTAVVRATEHPTPYGVRLRHAVRVGRPELVRLAVSSRTLAELPYAEEFAAAGALVVLSREDAAGGRAAGRITGAELAPLVPSDGPVLVCGSTSFTGAAVR